MANEIVKFGTSPDGTAFEQKFLEAASIKDTAGTTAQAHMSDTAKHLSAGGVAPKATTLATARTIAITGAVTGTAASFDGSANISIVTTSVNATKLTGVIPIASIPPAALERIKVVATDTDRLALTPALVQSGDTVKVTATGFMYFVKDDTKLSSEAGYEIYTAGSASSVPWGGITSKPTTLGGYGITDATTASLTTATQAEAEAGTSTTVRAWTPQRIRQAVSAAPKDIVYVETEAGIAASGVRAGGIVLVKV